MLTHMITSDECIANLNNIHTIINHQKFSPPASLSSRFCVFLYIPCPLLPFLVSCTFTCSTFANYNGFDNCLLKMSHFSNFFVWKTRFWIKAWRLFGPICYFNCLEWSNSPLLKSILNNHVCICRVCMIPLSFIFLPISTWEQLWFIMYKSCPRKWC